MSRLRTSMVLLALCVGALLASMLQLARDSRERLPAGSSYSFQTDGAMGLFLWSESLGMRPDRLRTSAWSGEGAERVLFVLQPESIISRLERDAFDEVPEHGGTLVLAGDSSAAVVYARQLGQPLEPMQITTQATTEAGQQLEVVSRYRVLLTGTPVLTTPAGNALGVRVPYRKGSLIVISTPNLLSNNALHDPAIAQFVYRTFLAPAQAVAFDESHHSYTPPTVEQPPTIERLLADTAPGQALLYVAVLIFVFVLLSGRRLGPALAERGAGQMRRTMYEHVQMLAGLYRRAGQMATVRAAFAHHYQRRAARSALDPAHAALLDEAVMRVRAAHSEADLIAAVSDADRALSAR